MKTVKASEFHPMRGHVEDGTVILFKNGSKAILKAGMRGWRLVAANGLQIGQEMESAFEVTQRVVSLDPDDT